MDKVAKEGTVGANPVNNGDSSVGNGELDGNSSEEDVSST